jgi:hypothetical protein
MKGRNNPCSSRSEQQQLILLISANIKYNLAYLICVREHQT